MFWFLFHLDCCWCCCCCRFYSHHYPCACHVSSLLIPYIIDSGPDPAMYSIWLGCHLYRLDCTTPLNQSSLDPLLRYTSADDPTTYLWSWNIQVVLAVCLYGVLVLRSLFSNALWEPSQVVSTTAAPPCIELSPPSAVLPHCKPSFLCHANGLLFVAACAASLEESQTIWMLRLPKKWLQ